MTYREPKSIRSPRTVLSTFRPGGARSTAPVTSLVLTLMTLLSVVAADPDQPAVSSNPALKTPTATNSLPANPDAAWKEIQSASRPPAPPAEWGGKAPTPEQRQVFNKTLGEKSALVAAKAKEFYTRFPNHPKAEDAKSFEKRFLEQAVAFGNTAGAGEPGAALSEDQKLKLKIDAVHRRALAKRAEGSVAVAKE